MSLGFKRLIFIGCVSVASSFILLRLFTQFYNCCNKWIRNIAILANPK